MRHLLIFALMGLCALSVGVIHAQEVDTETTLIIYYEDENPSRIDFLTVWRNVCYEAVMLLNPQLDIFNIAFGTPVIFPADQPCYDHDPRQSYMAWADGNPPRLKYYEDGQWLAEPYYSDEVVYIGGYNSIEQIVDRYNVCRDALLDDNILLHDFERYIAGVDYSIDVFIPRDAPPCDPNWVAPQDRFTSITLQADEITPLYLARQLNICAESIPDLFNRNYFYQPIPTVTLSVTNDAPPCYNEAGQRLRFYDDLGYPLEHPIYSDLEVYVAQAGETLETIAVLKQVCLIDLLRVNYFPELPAIVPIELFIPPRRACPNDLEALLVERAIDDIDKLAREMNICPQDLAPLNPHIHPERRGLYRAMMRVPYWAIVPTDAAPCYEIYANVLELTIFEIERVLNVCHEEFNGEILDFYSDYREPVIYVSRTAPPCYNAEGQRLAYPRDFTPDQRGELRYSEMQIHHFQGADSVYSISQQYNVCVQDILRENPILGGKRPKGYAVFIPNMRPCYDEDTRLPLIYEDENGDSLPVPQVAENLIYYGNRPMGNLSYYYNVCMNRLEDANRAKHDGETFYLGWIIPTDRPPCYDEMGMQILYVCYNEPVDLTRDYSAPNAPPLSFDYNGTHCYDLRAPQTVVWYENQRYEIISYEDRMLGNAGFMAWCYGVSLDAMNHAHYTFGAGRLDTLWMRVIPPRTRECYLSNPSVLAGHQTVSVGHQQTLGSIAANFPYTVEDFAAANDIEPPYIIYTGQQLIIPTGISIANLRALAISAISLAVIFAYLWRRSKRRVNQP